MVKKALATIRLWFPCKSEVTITQKALIPETESSLTRRSKVKVQQEGNNLALIFEAKDTIALRASINSYLNWLQLLNDIHRTLTPKKPNKSNRLF